MKMYDDAVLIALGGNLAGRFSTPRELLEAALARLPDAGFKLVRRSSWWRSDSWPDATRPAYLNALAIVETRLGPKPALQALQQLEALFGRTRRGDGSEERNAPRTLDLDLIAYGRLVLPGPEPPILPHPRAAERLFVMGPLAEIAPGWRHPVSGLTAEALAARASVGRDAAPES